MAASSASVLLVLPYKGCHTTCADSVEITTSRQGCRRENDRKNTYPIFIFIFFSWTNENRNVNKNERDIRLVGTNPDENIMVTVDNR
jgi:hypothetical protein